MKKLYEEPFFEVNKFSFEAILNNDNAQVSDPEDELGNGGASGEDPFA